MARKSKKSQAQQQIITEAERAAISKLPLMSARVLHSLLQGLYAEAGFSDVDAQDLANATGLTVKQVMGAFCWLKVRKLIWTDTIKINNEEVTFVFSQLHRAEWCDATCTQKDDGEASRTEAIGLVQERIHELTGERYEDISDASPAPERKKAAKKARAPKPEPEPDASSGSDTLDGIFTGGMKKIADAHA